MASPAVRNITRVSCHFLFSIEPIIVNLFAISCTVDFEGTEIPGNCIINFVRHFFIRFIPYVGLHNEILCIKMYCMFINKMNICALCLTHLLETD